MQVLSLRNLTKTFSHIRAVDRVSMDFHASEIHALLGENGAGKSTLMHLVSGLYQPDSGEICIDGASQVFPSARAALTAGIAMVHQHFMLIPSLTVAENVSLALSGGVYERLNTSEIARRAAEIAKEYGILVDNFHAQVRALPVGVQQRIEILKALATRARVLILDEPTAVLTSLEVENLFVVLRKLKQNGYLIILITHKIPEVLAVSDRLSVLRRGRLIATKETKSCSPDALANLMVEADSSGIRFSPGEVRISSKTRVARASFSPLVELRGVSVRTDDHNTLQGISFCLKPGEIIGFAGVDGNGQSDLAEVLIGLLRPTEGSIFLKGQQIHSSSSADFRAAGVSIIPQDRRREGLALELSIVENLLLNVSLLDRLAKGVLLPLRTIRNFAEKNMRKFSILPFVPEQRAAYLSGGNQQRVILARELSASPQVIVAVNPSRGLDIKATRYIHEQLRAHQCEGVGILLISTDLDEILSLSDMVYVLYQGRLLGPVASTINREVFGQMMGGVWYGPRIPD